MNSDVLINNINPQNMNPHDINHSFVDL